MILSTLRTRLVPFKIEDLEIFHSLNTDPYVRKFLWDDEIISLEMAKDIMIKNLDLMNEKSYGLWKIALPSQNMVIGYTGLWHFFDEERPQLLYVIKKEFSGLGYAAECAQKIIDYSFDILKFDSLIASTDPPNIASQRLAERLGMKLYKEESVNDKSTLFYIIRNGE